MMWLTGRVTIIGMQTGVWPRKAPVVCGKVVGHSSSVTTPCPEGRLWGVDRKTGGERNGFAYKRGMGPRGRQD